MLQAALALLLTQQPIPITEPLDHRDQWGVLATLGISLPSVIRGSEDYDPGLVPTLEVGVSRALTDLSELQLRVRIPDDPRLRPWILGGYHGYSSEGPFTTHYGIELVGATGHDWGVGAHASAGVQWDPVRWGGLLLTLGFAATAGPSFMLTFDGLIGGQLRY